MTRATLDLTGLWRCQPDVCQEGERERYYAADCDVRLWREVSMPAGFDRIAPGMESYEGVCWYRRSFEVPESWRDKLVVVRFEGVNYHARAWVNGEPAGEHADGFLRFDLPIGGLLRYGAENVLAVRVDNERRQGEVPGMERGWRTYGGILREVLLIATDRLRIEEPRIVGEPAEQGGKLSLQVRLVNGRDEEAEAELAVVIADSDGHGLARHSCGAAALSAGAHAVVQAELRVDGIRPWSPDDPALYTARLTLRAGGEVVDELDVRFGSRRIEATDEGLLLNGEPIFLTGFNRHEDSPRTGMCTDLETARRDLEEMKDAGCNFVRLCHYPHHPKEPDLCDELGLLAMAEIPVYWWKGLEEGEENCALKLQAARRQLTKMIRRDWNHPSLIFWSVSNETREDLPEVAEGNAELVRLAKELDPTRLAVHVSSHWGEHPHFECDDVVCVNAYPSWPTWGSSGEGRRPAREESTRFWTDSLARLRKRYPAKPILVTEFGYPCLEDVFGTAMGEDAQAEAIEAEFAGMTAPYVCGATIWCWADHPWPEEAFIRYVTTSPFGVLTRRRRKLKGFWTVRGLFRARQRIVSAVHVEHQAPEAGWLVEMIRPNLDDIPQVAFPPGFGIRPMRPGEAAVWTDIHRDAEPYITITDGLFHDQFGTDLPATHRRCFFIVDGRGVAVGTISAWYSRDFKGRDHGRIHWVATRRAYQRRGLGRAGLSYGLNRLAEWHERAYLTTQTQRLPAIKMYLDFGFLPDLEQPNAGVAWRSVREALKHPALEELDL